MSDRIDPRTAAQELLAGRYRGAKAIFLAGSCARGAHTAHSDLDVIALYAHTHPVREAFVYKGWPVDASTGDEASLVRTLTAAPHKGDATVPRLIFDSVVLPDRSPQTDALQQRAKAIIDAGPDPMSPREGQLARFSITYLRTKLQSPRAEEDTLSLGAMLHSKLGQFYLRANRMWGGTPTYLGRRLREENPELAMRLFEAFRTLFSTFDCVPVTALVEEVLAPHGGLLFDGFRDVHAASQPMHRRPLG